MSTRTSPTTRTSPAGSVPAPDLEVDERLPAREGTAGAGPLGPPVHAGRPRTMVRHRDRLELGADRGGTTWT
jgi:hypothetical protein